MTLEFPVSGGDNQFYEIPAQNFSFDFETIFYGEATTEALSGRLFQNFRGFRLIVDMTWERSFELVQRKVGAVLSDQTFRVLFNYMITHFVDNLEEYIKIYPGDIDYAELNTSNYLQAIPNIVRYRQKYRSQIGIFIPRIRLRGRDVIDTIPEYFEGS